MKNFRIKDFMNWKVALFVFMVCISIWVGTSMSTESSFLEATGGRSAANQKLMVVDQGTGEISFVKKSLAGINQNFTTEDVKIQNALKNLLGDNMSNYGGYTKTGNNGVLAKMAAADQARRAHEDEKYATKSDYATKAYVNAELDKKQGASDNILHSGDMIAIAHKNDKGCNRGAGCRAFTNFKKQGNSNEGAALEAGWKDADMHFGHGANSNMRIHKV
ncbi:MAG: hypothetical protein CMB31_04255 [Euryarchaeota archaeon]|nr:hypothetical protein [Euryarchaeota archaeon]